MIPGPIKIGKSANRGSHQVTDRHQGVRSLHHPEVSGPRLAPRRPLEGNSVCNRANRGSKVHYHEAGQQGPEGRSKGNIKPGEMRGGQPNPGGCGRQRKIVDTPRRRQDASHQDAGHRPPLLPGRRGIEAKSQQQAQADTDQDRGNKTGGALGHVGKTAQENQDYGGPHQHQHRARNQRREQSPQQGKTGYKDNQDQR